MGTEIQKERFNADDHERFRVRLQEQLGKLQSVLHSPGFSTQPHSIGAELELALVDEQGRPLPVSEHVVRAADTPNITPEMGAFDIELSTPPAPLKGAPFSALRESMREYVERIGALAARYGGRAVPISILPTLRREDFDASTITDLPRYRALTRELGASRGEPFEVAIDGEDSLRIRSNDVVAMEAANAAFQIHLSTSPADFADLFNAALLLSAPVLAAAANSPTFLGKRLWHETRVALFKQAGDDRPKGTDADLKLPPRVNFGNGWVREGAYELFLESVALHPTLLAECGPEEGADDPNALPSLYELRLHHGTVWTWNRPVYDPTGKNLRIELRSLPAGPTLDDMLANGAFLLGCMFALKRRMPQLTAALPFALARQNFYLAAQFGLDAQLSWPSETGAPEQRSARDVLLSLMEEAERGLAEAGVDPTERVRYLSVFAARVESGQTAAVWQSRQLAVLRAAGLPLDAALAQLLERYVAGCNSERPVHLWQVSVEGASDEDAVPVRDSEIFEVSAVSALTALNEARAGTAADEAGRV
ncbi:MAG TPA: hypothetical protein VFZ61_18440 [Polyangiales bacterium]